MTNNSGPRLDNEGITASSGRSGPNVTLIFLAIIAALAVIFFMQNGETTSIDFLFFEHDTTIRWSILIAVAMGIVLDRLFAIWWRRRRRKGSEK